MNSLFFKKQNWIVKKIIKDLKRYDKAKKGVANYCIYKEKAVILHRKSETTYNLKK